jgi:hypothetical protein
VDLARSLPFEQAVAVADDALHRGKVSAAELAVAMSRSGRRRGAPAARRVLAFADARSESVGESRSRVALNWAELPPAELQWNVWSRRGDHLGRVDFWWSRFRTVGEFDGQVKYGRLLLPGQEPGDVVFAEKRREDALRDEGLQVVRWTWRELDKSAAVAERIQRAFERLTNLAPPRASSHPAGRVRRHHPGCEVALRGARSTPEGPARSRPR